MTLAIACGQQRTIAQLDGVLERTRQPAEEGVESIGEGGGFEAPGRAGAAGNSRMMGPVCAANAAASGSSRSCDSRSTDRKSGLRSPRPAPGPSVSAVTAAGALMQQRNPAGQLSRHRQTGRPAAAARNSCDRCRPSSAAGVARTRAGQPATARWRCVSRCRRVPPIRESSRNWCRRTRRPAAAPRSRGRRRAGGRARRASRPRPGVSAASPKSDN